MMKLYVNRVDHFFYYPAKMVADFTNTPIEVVVVSEEQQAAADFKAKKAHGKFPMLELADGTVVFESNAIGQHIARAANSAELFGKTPFEEAQIESFQCVASAQVWPHSYAIAKSVFGFGYNLAAFNDACKAIKEQTKMLNSHLAKKAWLVGERLTLADIFLYTSLVVPFSFVLDAGFRKAMPHVSAWFEKMSKLPFVARTAGYIKMCDKAFKPVDPTKVVPVPVEKKEAKKADEDDFDPFADDGEDDAAAAKALQDKVNADKPPKKAKVVIAKSIIVWEVKPYAAEVNLDYLAKRIIDDVAMDGIVWKTEYKKEPVAFGVFKLVIGAVVEDEKVSTDDIAEKVEALEYREGEQHKTEDDEEVEMYLVQSVDIQSFNKI